MDVLLELHYLPCIEYVDHLLSANEIWIEAHEHYQKQSYRNRCKILMANKIESLSVPILEGSKKILIRDVKIDYSQFWQKVHQRSIQTAYGKAPYYEHFSDYFRALYDKKPTYLWDFNLEALTVCLRLLRQTKTLNLTTEYNKNTELLVETIIDKRSSIVPKVESTYKGKFYTQVFGREFVPNLSILDLIFNEGPNGILLLNRGR